MACGYPLNASPWLNAEKSHRIKTLPEYLGYGVTPMCSKHPSLCGTRATKAISSSFFLFLYSLTCISLSFSVCVCVFVYLYTHTKCHLSLSLFHIPSPPPFFFPHVPFFLIFSSCKKFQPSGQKLKNKKTLVATELLFYCDYLLLMLVFFFFLLYAHTHNSYFW